MATPPESAPVAAERRESPRVALARVAVTAALTQPAITGVDGGNAATHTTFAGTERLEGVTVMPRDERYDVALYLTAEPTDLRALGGEVQRAVRSAAAVAQLEARLGEVHVTFTDLTFPDETTRP